MSRSPLSFTTARYREKEGGKEEESQAGGGEPLLLAGVDVDACDDIGNTLLLAFCGILQTAAEADAADLLKDLHAQQEGGAGTARGTARHTFEDIIRFLVTEGGAAANQRYV